MPLERIADAVHKYLDEVQAQMYTKAKAEYDAHLKTVSKWDDVVPTLDAKNVLVLPWCEDEACEDQIKDRSASQ